MAAPKNAAAKTDEVAAQDRVPLRQKLAYGLGITADHYACTKGLWVFFMPFFNDFLKIGATGLGIILALGRAWDAINDPLVGWLSDRSKSRFGRRRPFIFVGAILTGLTFPLLWLAPTGYGETATYVFITLGVFALYTSFSVFSVPYESLGAELTADYKERTDIFSTRAYLIYTLNKTIDFMMPLALLLGGLAFVGSDANGVRIVGVLMGIIIMATGVFPALFCIERYQKIARKEDDAPQAKLGFVKAVKALLTNRPLMVSVGVMAIYLFAVMSAHTFAYYINTYVLFDGDRWSGSLLTLAQQMCYIPFAIIGAFTARRLSDRFDKHQLMKVSVTLLGIGFLVCLVTYRPDMPWLSLAAKPIWAFAESWFWILILSMRADVCDWDEVLTGHRREGVIAATTNWFNKLATAMAAFFGAFCLEKLAGFDVKVPESAKDPAVMQKLLNWYVALPFSATVVCFVLLIYYPLTSKKMAEVRKTLEARRGKAIAEETPA